MNDMASGFQRGAKEKFRVGSNCFHKRRRDSIIHKTTTPSFCNHRGKTLHLFFNARSILVHKRNHCPFVLQSQRKNLVFVLQRAKPQVHYGSICMIAEPRLDIPSAPPVHFRQRNRN